MVLEMPSENRQCQCRGNIWLGSLFQTQDAMDEKDFEVAIDVCLMWTLKSKAKLSTYLQSFLGSKVGLDFRGHPYMCGHF